MIHHDTNLRRCRIAVLRQRQPWVRQRLVAFLARVREAQKSETAFDPPPVRRRRGFELVGGRRRAGCYGRDSDHATETSL